MNKVKYKTGFTGGALLYNEMDMIIHSIVNINLFLKGKEQLDYSILLVNSESSKKRYASEISQRIIHLNKEIYNLYLASSVSDKKTILFYLACKSYTLITDFMLEVILNKWLNLDYEVSTDDFLNYIYRKMGHHTELEEITDKTKYKIAQVMLKMLKDIGMLKNAKLIKKEYDNKILEAIVKNGDKWFLDVLLLNESEKNEILSK